MPCRHATSLYSQAPARIERRDSVSSLTSVSSTMEYDSIVQRPSLFYATVPDSSLHGLSNQEASGTHIYGNSYLYICCQCNDGPKLYNNQPKCVMCQHTACPNCVHVK
ncbi:hypothetical protein BBP40_012657 [Aspergillus hancockii]|nr:hypothetical protein BBP40_012657 [Aspergillus hancockii]